MTVLAHSGTRWHRRAVPAERPGRLPSGMRLPRAAVRLTTRGVVAPLLSPGLPLALRRRLLDLTGYVVPGPAGTRRTATTLGGVPTELVVARGAHGPHRVLYLHGGGYQTGSPASHRALTAHLGRAAAAPVHVPAYRLAPEHPFPAALDDALAAFRALRAAGHPARRIAVLGDSAGGGLAMALVLRLRAAGEDLPGSVGLISPWLDLDLTSPWLAANAASDAMLDPGWLGTAADGYRAGADAPELRPLEADLAGLPPLHVVAGADEVLVGDADTLVERARAAGAEVSYVRTARMWHAFPVFAGMLAEADAAVDALGTAVRRDCASRRPAAEAHDRPPAAQAHHRPPAAEGQHRRPRVTVVGAGFGGIGLGAVMRGSGVADVTILDKAAGVGGVWRDNTYPGAACDVPSHLYSFSFAPGREWSRRFAPQPDILRYLQRVAAEYGLEPRLDTEVTEARWDDARAVWRLDLADGGSLETDVLVPACGQLSVPATPRLPGLDSFPGPVFHSARWRHDVDLTGRRVAVIGTGASAIQFVPAIVDRVSAMTVFQRSAPYLIPKPDRRYGALTRALLHAVPAARLPARGFWTAFFETGALGFTRFPTMTRPFRWAHDAMLRRQVPDPALRARLQPDYPVGCKRVGISSQWFPALARPHVDVVTEAVTAVTPTGVRTADGTEHPADVIIFGTGFATTDFLAPMKVFGPGGVELSERWREGARAHLGITVPGFPNLFLLYGPNTNVGSGSIVTMLESQIAYVRQAIETLAAGTRTLAVRPEVESAFDTEMQQRLDGSVWTGCHSWYRTASGRIVNNWPGLMHEYRRRTSTFDVTEYETT
jgi:cation diffusion facilitator CzcD-associated flavoprotein CzcO/acetyl esterase/lipase